MGRIIPREKLSRKARKALDLRKRETWPISPVTKKIESRKRYDRKRRTRDRDDDGAGLSLCRVLTFWVGCDILILE